MAKAKEAPEFRPDPEIDKMMERLKENQQAIVRDFSARWEAEERAEEQMRQRGLYCLQVACWVIMLIGAALVAARAIKQFKNYR